MQCWICEHFPIVASCVADEDYHERKPHAFQWKFGKALSVSGYHKWLDKLTSNVVRWNPYGDHYSFREFEKISLFFRQIRWGPSIVIHRPERVGRQFSYVQTIDPHLIAPIFIYRGD